MHDAALHIIRSFQKRWIIVSLLTQALLAAAIAGILTFLCNRFFGFPWWSGLLLFTISFLVLLVIDSNWCVKEREVVRFLNKTYPSLEESCELLLRESKSYNLLEELQVIRTSAALQQVNPPLFFNKNIRRALVILFGALVLCSLLSLLFNAFDKADNAISDTNNRSGKINLPTGITGVDVKVIPPGYTHKQSYKQSGFDLHVVSGSIIQWQVVTSAPVTELAFIYNDSSVNKLKFVNKEHTIWQTDKLIERPGFYQVKINNAVSELFKIEVIKDEPPVIIIQSPRPATTIDFGEPEKVNLRAIVSDDYGVSNVTINATVAKGSGEGVKFKEQQISFGASFASQQRQYELQKTIGLAALNMGPGDELYFYLAATDNHGQEKRSDVYIVSITDTAQLMSMDGLLNGINVKPDYFRSQRQIIIDAEQLIKEKDTVGAENFKNRSNNLGIDQKLLRLRYGKFLGEESSSNEDNAGGNVSENAADFGNASSILDAFTDHHDNAEDATFLDPETKKQLKATLTEMWNSELQLRLFKPQDALPYAYKALRLLKDLQQKSRAYVAKTSIKTSPVKLEKRLTGKLDKITEPYTRVTMSSSFKPGEELRDALGVLEQLKMHAMVTDRSIQSIRLATIQLSNYASKEPALYLKPLEAMKRIVIALQNRQQAGLQDILLSQRALQKMAELPLSLPSRKQTAPAPSLSEQYFRNLQKSKTE